MLDGRSYKECVRVKLGSRISFRAFCYHTFVKMLRFFTPALLIAQYALAAPVSNAAAATVGKIRGVSDPIFHLYLQANPKNGTLPSSIIPSSRPMLTICISFYPRPRARSQRRRIHHRNHNPEQKDEPVPQHSNRKHKL